MSKTMTSEEFINHFMEEFKTMLWEMDSSDMEQLYNQFFNTQAEYIAPDEWEVKLESLL